MILRIFFAGIKKASDWRFFIQFVKKYIAEFIGTFVNLTESFDPALLVGDVLAVLGYKFLAAKKD